MKFLIFCLASLLRVGYIFADSVQGDDPQFTVVAEGNKKGLRDEQGKAVIPIQYEDLGWSQGAPQVYHQVIGYREGRRWGLIDVKNRKVCAPRFQRLFPYVDKLLVAAQYKEKTRALVYGLVNTDGTPKLAFRYLSLVPHGSQLIASILKGQQQVFGLLDERGRAIVGFEYTGIQPLSATRYALRDRQQKVALFDDEGNALTPHRYDSIGQFRRGWAITYLRDQQGLIDPTGKERLPNQYQAIRMDSNGAVSTLPFRQWEARTRTNKIVNRYTFNNFQPVGVNLYRVKAGATETFVDGQGEVVVPEQWRAVRFYEKFAVLTEQGKYGVLRNVPSGSQVVVPIQYDSVRVDGNYLIAGKKSVKAGDACYGWRIFDAEGQSLSPYTYQAIETKSEGLFPVKRKNHWGYVDTTGQEVIACQYATASPFDQGQASVDFVDGQGVIDKKGRWVVNPFKRSGAKLQLSRINDNLYLFRTQPRPYEAAQYGLIDQKGHERYRTNHKLIDNGHSLWERTEAGRYGLIAYTGRRLLATKYDTVSNLQEGKVYVFGREGQYGILSWNGKMLQDLDNNFEELHAMSNTFLGVKINGKYGFVDEWGRLRIANRYDSITHFRSNMAAVKMLGRWGYINKSERLVVQPRFERADPFRGKVAVVKKKGKYGMVNTQGRAVVPLVYDRIVPTEAGRYLLYQSHSPRGTTVGLASAEGKPLIHPKYDSIDDLGNGYVIVSRNGKYGLLTQEGRTTIPMVHASLIHDSYNEVYLTVVEPKWEKVKSSNSD